MKLDKFKFLLVYFIATLVFCGPLGASKTYAASTESVLVDIIPPNPAPYQNVEIDLNSYADNLDSVRITWSIDDKEASYGIGKKSFSLQAPGANLETIIIASIDLPDGNIEKRIVLRPSIMIMLWQANDSYVPPFYKGKALPTADSEIKIIAMPEVKNTDPKNMTYFWKKEYANDQEASGYGKNSFLYTNDYLENSDSVSVNASTLDGGYSADGNIDVGVTEPKIIFYKNDNAMGTLWDNAIGNTHRIDGGEVIVASPYFIAPKQLLHPALVWSWSINNEPVKIFSFRKNFFPLEAQAGATGTSTLSLNIENKYKIFQTANKTINIEF